MVVPSAIPPIDSLDTCRSKYASLEKLHSVADQADKRHTQSFEKWDRYRIISAPEYNEVIMLLDAIDMTHDI